MSGQHSIFLPFIHPFGAHGVPLVHATVSGIPLTLPVDTGSTGLLIGAPILPHVPRNIGTPVHHYFTSSNILYLARLVELDVVFHGKILRRGEGIGSRDEVMNEEREGSATARVPVLVVDESFVCPWYRAGIDGGTCPTKDGREAIRRDVSGIMYMGVGFGRNSPHDGMPAAIPAHNPFLNIEAINGVPVTHRTSTSSPLSAESSFRSSSPSTFSECSISETETSSFSQTTLFHTGYTLSTHGIHLGLTPHTTRNFTWTPLRKGLRHAHDPRDWSMPEMHFSINSSPETHRGNALIDTGIPHMYLRTAREYVIPNITMPNPNPGGFAKVVRRVKNGTHVAIGFSSFKDGGGNNESGGAVAKYAFRVGDKTAHAPAYVVPNNDGKRGSAGPYVNTGRNFLWAFDVAFDAIEGRFGFRAVERDDEGHPKEKAQEKERERFDARL